MDGLDAHILGRAAARADRVVVRDLLDLEAGHPVTEPHLLQESRFGEIGEHPVDGRAIHLPVALEAQPDVLGAEMGSTGMRGDRQDRDALRRGPEPGGADGLPRRRLAAPRRPGCRRTHRRQCTRHAEAQPVVRGRSAPRPIPPSEPLPAPAGARNHAGSDDPERGSPRARNPAN